MSDDRLRAADARRRHATREGQTTRTYPPGAGRNRGLGPPTPATAASSARGPLTVAEALAELGPLTVGEALAELEQKG